MIVSSIYISQGNGQAQVIANLQSNTQLSSTVNIEYFFRGGNGGVIGGTFFWVGIGSTWNCTVTLNVPASDSRTTGFFRYHCSGNTTSWHFATNESEPSDGTPNEYFPSYYPPVTDQWVWINDAWESQADSCVANTKLGFTKTAADKAAVLFKNVLLFIRGINL